MENRIQIAEKFEPLFSLLNDNFRDVDTVIITGGRYSLKSYTVAIFSLVSLVDYGWNTLYTRYTNLSITDSVKPEVSDKIDLLGYSGLLEDTNTSIECKNNRISFKGIKTGSSMQSANLKSLSGFNLFVNDEAEELPDFKTFKKIFYSIRSTDMRNLTILILNPTTKDHWIYKEFFEDRGVEGGSNCVKDNVMYIHTSYLDADRAQMPKNILADYERMKIDKPDEYENIVLGGWITDPEGVLVPKSKISFQELDIDKIETAYSFSIIDPADKGGDKYSMPFVHVIQKGDNIAFYFNDWLHNTQGIEANSERMVQYCKDNHTEDVLIEANGIGLAAVFMARKGNAKINIVPFTSSLEKDTRILSNYEFIPRHFIFSETKYKNNPEYKLAVDELTSFVRDGDNKHKKDSMDVACMVAAMVKSKYKKILYG